MENLRSLKDVAPAARPFYQAFADSCQDDVSAFLTAARSNPHAFGVAVIDALSTGSALSECAFLQKRREMIRIGRALRLELIDLDAPEETAA